jgi:hypothetical protein
VTSKVERDSHCRAEIYGSCEDADVNEEVQRKKKSRGKRVQLQMRLRVTGAGASEENVKKIIIFLQFWDEVGGSHCDWLAAPAALIDCVYGLADGLARLGGEVGVRSYLRQVRGRIVCEVKYVYKHESHLICFSPDLPTA